MLGIGLPEEFGGTGAEDPVLLGIACEEIGAADVNLAAAPVTVGLTGAQLAKGATPAGFVLTYIGEFQDRWPDMMAASVVVSLPIVVLFTVFQKQLVSGLTAGAVKG